MVNRDKLKLTVLQQNILNTLFVKVGILLSQRDLSKILNVSPPAIKKAIPHLIKNNLINVEFDKSRRTNIGLNFENPSVISRKRIFNLNSIYSSGLYGFLDQNLAGATIILFGSYSDGEDTLKSDIDIAIIGRKEKEVDLSKYEKYLEREIVLQFYDKCSKIHKNLRENIFNGVVYSGGIEL